MKQEQKGVGVGGTVELYCFHNNFLLSDSFLLDCIYNSYKYQREVHDNDLRRGVTTFTNLTNSCLNNPFIP